MLVVQVVYLHKGMIIWGADWVTVNTSAIWTLRNETSSRHWMWALLLCQWTHLCVIKYLISTLEPWPNPPILAILCFLVSGICCTASCQYQVLCTCCSVYFCPAACFWLCVFIFLTKYLLGTSKYRTDTATRVFDSLPFKCWRGDACFRLSSPTQQCLENAHFVFW